MRLLIALLLAFVLFCHASAQTTLPPEMVFVQGGSFTMGCTPEQVPDCNIIEELPARRVRICDFQLGKFEISQKIWATIMNTSNQLFYGTAPDDYPYYHANFYNCLTFCNKLSLLYGLEPVYFSDSHFSILFDTIMNMNNFQIDVCKATFGPRFFWKQDANGYRLPTEAEWEYAARGGAFTKSNKYAGSNNAQLVAQYNQNGPTNIGKKAPNELSLFDMSGNISEWCFDSWSEFGTSQVDLFVDICNPWFSTSNMHGLARGGYWFDKMDNTMRVSYRRQYSDSSGGFYCGRQGAMGLRLARNAD